MSKSSSQQQQYEHLLFGSVTDAELSPLLHRLRGLCDYATAGGLPFVDREIGYKIGSKLKAPSDVLFQCVCLYVSVEAGNAVTRMKVRQSLDNPEAPWSVFKLFYELDNPLPNHLVCRHLIYTGQIELGVAAVRTCIVTACSQNLMECLNELGFTYAA